MRGVSFGDWHSWRDWGLVLSEKSIGLPEVHTEYVSIMGRHGDLDLSQALSEEPSFGNRTLSFTFSSTEALSGRDWAELLAEVGAALHGQRLAVVLDEAPLWQYTARCSVDRFQTDGLLQRLVIVCNAEPLRTLCEDSGDWLWDSFSFEEGVLYTDAVTVDGTVTLTLLNPGPPTHPTLQCSAAMSLLFEGTEYSLSAGENVLYTLRLQYGANSLSLTGKGTVEISYAKRSL